MNEKDVEMNLTVGTLKKILNSEFVTDDMLVIIPNTTEDDRNRITGFRHVRTVGILESEYEDAPALCISAPDFGMDMESQLGLGCGTHITCKRVMF